MVKTKNKFSLSQALMKIDCEVFATVIFILMALQPLYGIFDIVSSQEDLIALFYGKATAIRLIGAVGFAVGIIFFYQQLRKHGTAYIKKKLLSNPWNLMFLLSLVWACLTSSPVLAQNYHIAFFSYAYRYEGLISYFAYAGMYLCGSIIRDDKRRQRIIDFALIVAAVLALFTFLSQVEGNSDTIIARGGWVGAYSGTFINTNHYGYYLCVILMLSAGRMMTEKNIGFKFFFLGSFILNEAVLLKNNSFGPFLAVTIGLVGIFVVFTVRDSFRKSWWLLLPLVIFFVLDIVTNDAAMTLAFKSTFNEILEVFGVATHREAGQSVSEALTQENNVGSGRMKIWLAAIDVWKQHIMTGVGPENIPMEMHDALGSYEAVHNEYIQVLAEMGIIGFILYFGGQVVFFVRSVMRTKSTPPSALIAYGAVAAYLVSAAFGITITVSEVFFFFVLGLANGSHTSEVLDELEGVNLSNQ